MRTSKARTGLRARLACHERWSVYGSNCRHTPEVGAVCGKAARTVLCGGRDENRVPTATREYKAPRVHHAARRQAVAWPPAPQLLNRLDRTPCELDPLLATQQLQQAEQAFVRTQGSEHSDLLAQRAADDPHAHAGPKPARLEQLDKTATFPRPDLTDDSIGNVRRDEPVHDEAN